MNNKKWGLRVISTILVTTVQRMRTYTNMHVQGTRKQNYAYGVLGHVCRYVYGALGTQTKVCVCGTCTQT